VIERYTLPEMKELWSPQNRYQKWLEIEILACEAWAELGKIPASAVETIKKKASFDLQRIAEIEEVTKHDVIAFLSCVAESVGDEGKFLHMGLTSYDVVDTALSLLMRDALEIILEALEKLLKLLQEKALAYKDTVMIGRTHGVHAEPITLGLKFALWYCELQRARQRLERAKEVISVGRLSGAVGTYAHIDPYVEAYVCRKLGLKPAKISTQVLQRDRHAEYLNALAVTAASLEKFAVEIRHLQRTEVLEVEESFAQGQKGSSAMPHKRNPITCERLTGLARVVRGNALAALENIALWHERDISHSSVERIIIPDSTTLLHYMIVKFTEILQGLQVYPARMEKNLQLTKGLIFSQRLLLALVEKGLLREEAYALVQRLALQAWPEGDFRDLVKGDPEIGSYLSAAEIDALFDYRPYLENVDYIFWKAGLSDPPVAKWEQKARVRLVSPKRSGEKRELVYEGKAKKVYKTSDPDLYLVEFKDQATAFDGMKKEEIPGKGRLNNLISAYLFALLECAGVATHFVSLVSETEMLVRAVEVLPLEVIVRNLVAGSMAKRLGMPEGRELSRPLVSFCYKSDQLHDPLLTEEEIIALELVTPDQLTALKEISLKCNQVLRTYFQSKGILLVDFKLEFGFDHQGELLLVDEISPDTCRLWDLETGEKLDKDRFRRDLGDLISGYQKVWQRMQGGEG